MDVKVWWKYRVIVDRVEYGQNFWKRLRGLAWRRDVAADTGLWLPYCRSVHTCFMFTKIDVCFLNQNGFVVALYPSLPPWQIAYHKKAVHTLELRKGTCAQIGIQVGDLLTVLHSVSSESLCPEA